MTKLKHITPQMKQRQAKLESQQWVLDAAINVVLFAGLGGACQGLEEAGFPITVANNHDDVALAAHAALHPHTRHVRGDIFDVDPLQATRGLPVNILWGSPDCRDHSRAKGGAPRSPRVRSLPWQMCRWAGKTRPQVIFIENVTEIRGWGPLKAQRCKMTGRVIKLDGTVAAPGERVPVQQQALTRDKQQVGRSYQRFVAHLKSLGYSYDDRDLVFADYGVPTTRKRFFAVARRDGHTVVWPEVTHAPRAHAANLNLQPWKPAASIIDWSIAMPSIFDRKERGRKELAEASLRRVAVGLQRYVLANPRPFLLPLTHQGDSRVRDSLDPAPTFTSAHRGEWAMAAPMVAKWRENSPGSSIEEPLPTVTANGHSSTRAGCAIPLGVSAAYLTEQRGRSTAQSVEAPLGCQTAVPHHALAAAYAIQTGYGERPGQDPRVVDLEAPIGTQVTNGGKHALCAAFMAQHNLGVVGHPVDAPMSTLTTTGAQQQIAGAYLTKYYRSEESSQDCQDPLHTVTSKARISVTASVSEPAAANYLVKLRGTSTAADIEEPAPTFSAGGNHIAHVAALLERFGKPGPEPIGDTVTVMVGGVEHVVFDIVMRMLEPHEAAAAHELVLPASIEVNGKHRPLTKTEAMRLVGNSVPKRLPYLLALANVATALDVRKLAAD